MADEKYDPNRAGSACAPRSTDAQQNYDAQEAIDRANRASELHREANKLADRSGRK